jgi:hypothetical protein
VDVGLPRPRGEWGRRRCEGFGEKAAPARGLAHFQECTCCSESFIRSSHPIVADILLDKISLDYTETLQAAAGFQTEECLHRTMKERRGEYLLMVEDALGVAVPPNAELIRNLMFCAQYMQDHVVHFYHLHALDWVDVVSALKADPAEASRIAQSISNWPTTSTSTGSIPG